MQPSRSVLGPGIILVLALLIGGWFLQQGVAQDQNVYVQTRLLQEVADHIADRFVDPVEREALYQSAIEGMIRGLGDPNTSLLSRDAYENFRIQTEGDYGGVGLEIVDRDDYITVVSPLPEGPGARAGIRAGDEIIEVEGESTRGWSSQQAVQVLRGRPGAETEVRIRRAGVAEPIDFTLTREQIQIRSVPFAALLDDGVGYLPLRLFSETSTGELRAAADSLVGEGATSLILDLRGNPGGVLDQGIQVADLFLDQGDVVAETRGQAREQNTRLTASSPDRFQDLPLVVLLDRGSASASEIVAGALQDHDRAVVVGMPSFGKGSVQSLFSLTGGNVLKLTTARWYTPRGRSIESPREGEATVAELPEGHPELQPQPEADPDAEMEPQELPETDESPRDDAEPSTDRRSILTVDGQFVQVPDTTGRPVVTSYAGRTLYGGGGIVPDLLVLPDTLATDEQLAVQSLFRRAGQVNTAIFNHAVSFLQEHEVDPEDFALRDDELDRLLERLAEKGLEVETETASGARRFLLRQLGGEIAGQAGGERGRFLRQAPDDALVRRSMELLAGVEDRADLFARAGSPIPAASADPVTGESDNGTDPAADSRGEGDR